MSRHIGPHPDVRHTPAPSDQLRAIARRVRRLGHGCSRNPVERFVVERDSLGRELELLAEQAEGAR